MRSRRRGVVANVAGIGALQGAIGAGVFCSSKAAMTCATEALHAETSPLGINVCLIQLGHFRTAFLNPGHRLKTQATLADYDVVMESTRKIFDDFDGSQQGDPKEAGRLIVDVLTQSGRAEGRCIPGYLAVGSDVVAATEKVRSSRQAEMEAWARLSHSTDLTDH
jgi:NAD(P)-dependent dehydrogenase (short-subunit alcohol dehydrogenase family)